ncbi:MAG: right-handed parallel beta-helix repeat-containing protein [Prolixibacteraceae bacterium]|nr:right-handed parallel beta-helix repeat-containing protein [Prolixibacteraceae bacterium]
MKGLKLVLILAITSVVSFAGCKKKDTGPITNALKITAANGTVVKNPNQEVYENGAHVQLTATANANYTFSSWGGDAAGTANPLTITMDANKNIVANFTVKVDTYSLMVTATNGTVAKKQDLAVYNSGTSVQLSAIPNSGYTFTSWSGDATGNANPLTISVNANKNIVANFAAIPHNLDVRSKGAKGDGVTDDTAALQAAVDQIGGTNDTVFVSNGTYMIHPSVHLNLKSNMTLKMANGAVLKAIPVSSDGYAVVNLSNIQNVTIIGGKVEGERGGHTGAAVAGDGHGHGFTILGTDNIMVKDLTVKNCWGDGIYVGKGTVMTKNVTIDNVISDNNRRQGMSVVMVDGMVVKNSVFKNTNGTDPQAGIDLEPNLGNTVNNVKILNCQVIDNAHAGIVLWVSSGFTNTYVTNVTIDGCTVDRNMQSAGIVAVTRSPTNITNNKVRNNAHYGLVIESSNGAITGNTITDNGRWGIELRAVAHGNNVTGNTVLRNVSGQIVDRTSGNNTIVPNTTN